MKTRFLSICLLALSFTGFADNLAVRQWTKTSDDDPMLNNGFYLHMGMGFPRFTIGNSTQNPGNQYNLEIGNQWYFTKIGSMGLAFKVSWLQFGYCTKSYSFGSMKTDVNIYEVRLPKIGPMFTYSTSDKSAIDASLDLSYPVLTQVYDPEVGDTKAYPYGGVSISPCIRFRYKKFAAGIDYSFGNVRYLGDDKAISTASQGYKVTRVFVGLKF